ncbi:MAG: DUF4129 domain-containing protein [Halobacterium sp.]
MDRNVRALILALLCVLAVSLAAATVVNPQAPPGSGGGGGGAPRSQTGDTGDSGNDSQDVRQTKPGGQPISFSGVCVPFLTTPAFFGIAILVVGGLTWLLKRRKGTAFAVATVFPLVLFVFPFWLLMTDCGSASPAERVGGVAPKIPPKNAAGGAGSGAGDAASQLVSPPLLLGLLVVVAAVLAYLVYRASGDDDVEEAQETVDPAPEPDEDDALAAVGTAAGEAADRIEETTDVENEVYRAWREMTTHIDVPNPDTSTPAEFASAAREAGMDDEHVETLTALFRDVRYGGRDATEDREQRAVDALRAIEDRYADGGDD